MNRLRNLLFHHPSAKTPHILGCSLLPSCLRSTVFSTPNTDWLDSHYRLRSDPNFAMRPPTMTSCIFSLDRLISHPCHEFIANLLNAISYNNRRRTSAAPTNYRRDLLVQCLTHCCCASTLPPASTRSSLAR